VLKLPSANTPARQQKLHGAWSVLTHHQGPHWNIFAFSKAHLAENSWLI